MKSENIKKEIKQDKKEILGILDMIKKRKFKGYTGMAVKNSIFQFSTTLVAKAGSLIFTIIIARLLMPELFGLYSLALSTIILFASFSDLGVSQALIRYASKLLGKNKKKKAKAYALYLGKIKFILILATSLILLISAKFVSENYYHKPIFLALIAGSIYILFSGFLGFINSLFFSVNKFKYPFFKEILFQILRLIIVPLSILLLIKSSSNASILFVIILSLSFAYLIALIFMLILMKKKIGFLKEKPSTLSKKEKRQLLAFTLPLSAMALSGIFFGYIDMIMLGRYVASEFIGYYRAAFSLIGALIPLIGFSGALFPVFSRLKGKRLERGMKKSIKVVLLISFILFLGTLLFSSIIIKIIFGANYSQSINILRLLSVLLLVIPLSALYNSYLISCGKTKLIAGLLIFSTIINIILNYVFIIYGLRFGMMQAVLGAAIATIISRFIYLGGLIVFRKSSDKKDLKTI